MLHRAIATLRETLRPHLGLGKDRVETLALIRHLLRSDPLEAIAPWLRIAPKRIKISRVV